MNTVTGVCGGSDWCMDMTINSKDIMFKLDTGAQANVLPGAVYAQIANSVPLMKTTNH